jgi:hypothetical protein
VSEKILPSGHEFGVSGKPQGHQHQEERTHGDFLAAPGPQSETLIFYHLHNFSTSDFAFKEKIFIDKFY